MKTNSKSLFFYINGLCGSGKSHQLINYIRMNVLHKHIIIVPTKILLDQYRKAIPNSIAIDSDTFRNVGEQIRSSIASINQIGHGTLIITHTAFFNISFFEDKKSWNLWVDEIPQIDNMVHISAPAHLDIFKQYLNIDQSVGVYKKMYKLSIRDRSRINQHDDACTLVTKIVRLIDDGHDAWLMKSSYDKLDSGITEKDEGTIVNPANQLQILTLLSPEKMKGFKRTTIMGANFTHSMMYFHFTNNCNVNFEVFTPIHDKLRYHEHSGKSITINYFQQQHFSAKQRDTIRGEKTSIEHFCDDANKLFDGKPFLYAINEKVKTVCNLNGTQMPIMSQGINDYSSYHNIVFLPTLNRVAQHENMLKWATGMDTTFIRRAHIHEVAYQAAMRTSLRDPKSQHPVTILVADQPTAEELVRIFGKCDITIGCIFSRGHKVKKVTKTRQSRALKLNALYDIKKSTKSTYNVSTIGDIYQKQVLTTGLQTRIEIISQLKQYCSNNIIVDKTDNMLFNTTTYNNDQRGIDNAIESWGLVFDIDDGDMTHEQLTDILKDFSHVTFSTFSTGLKNSYRCIVMLKRPVNSQEYGICHKFIRDLIQQAGFEHCTGQTQQNLIDSGKKLSGIDLSKTHCESFFYMPCKVQGREHVSFFDRNKCKDEYEIERKSLDVDQIIASEIVETTLDQIIFEQVEDKQQRYATIEQLICRFVWVDGNFHDNCVKIGQQAAMNRIALHEIQSGVRPLITKDNRGRMKDIADGYMWICKRKQ